MALLSECPCPGADTKPVWADSKEFSKRSAMNSSAACIMCFHISNACAFLIEKFESLLAGHRAALLVGQPYQMRQCDFRDHPISVFLFCHVLPPNNGFSARPESTCWDPTSADCKRSAVGEINALTGNSWPSKSRVGGSCSAMSYVLAQDVRQRRLCRRSVRMRLSRHR